MVKIKKGKTIYTQKAAIHTWRNGTTGFVLYFGLVKTKDNLKSTQMRKCVVLFMILIFALICAAVLESKDMEMQSDWSEMAVNP
ncbi:hypothetical protein [Flagellimonas sp. 2504JD1-5]